VTETPVIRFDNVSKRFRIYHEKHYSLKENILTMFRNRRNWEDFWALRSIDLEVPHGQMIGLIGENGSGKSTCLKLLARILNPDTGNVSVSGSLSALIELGAGFQPDFTGRENVYLNGSILGFSKHEIDERYDEIVSFAELEKFIDTPVKNYSSGMYMRLGFSIAMHVNPDILLIDEILAVGDAAFQAKCLEKIQNFRTSGKTIVFVSHALASVEGLCDRAVLLSHGKLVADGKPAHVVAEYRRRIGTSAHAQTLVPELYETPEDHSESSVLIQGAMAEVSANVERVRETASWLEKRIGEPISIENMRERLEALENTMAGSQRQGAIRDQALGDLTRKLESLESRIHTLFMETPLSIPRRFGTKEIELLDIAFIREDGSVSRKFRSGESLRIRVGYRQNEEVTRPVFGVSMSDQKGNIVFGTNTMIDEIDVTSIGAAGTIEIQIDRLNLLSGLFYVTLAAHSNDNRVQYDRLENYYQIEVEPRRSYDGRLDMECSWDIRKHEVES